MKDNFAYTKNNRIIEFPSRNKEYWKFMLLKIIAFIIDMILVIILEVIMTMLFDGFFQNIGLISVIGLAYYVIYNMLFMFMFKGQTLGMKIAKISAVHKSGFKTTKSLLLVRGLMSGFYAMPILGWAMMITSMISAVIYRGMSMVDMTSMTAVVTINAFRELNKIEEEYLEKELGDKYE